jgi:hypothetical protein
MGVGTSIIVFAVGAILKFATNVHSSSFNIQTIGVILMIVGAVGFVVSLFFWSSWGGFGGWGGGGGGYRRRTVYNNDPRYTGVRGPGPGRAVVEEDERSGYAGY